MEMHGLHWYCILIAVILSMDSGYKLFIFVIIGQVSNNCTLCLNLFNNIVYSLPDLSDRFFTAEQNYCENLE